MLPRPSNAGRWVPCPASHNLEAAYPDVTIEEAEEGIAAHWAAAQVLGGHRQLDELVDRAAPNGVIVTGEMVEHIQTYIDAIGPAPVVVEKTIDIVPGIEPGTPDAVRVVDESHGHVWDFKYGWGIVEVKNNWQLICYAVGLFAKHHHAGHPLTDVTVTIVQPRPSHPSGRVRSVTYTAAEIYDLAAHLQSYALRTTQPNAPCVTGDHCGDCKAITPCEAARRASLNAVDVAYTSQPNELSGEDLAQELRTLRRAADMLKARLDAQEARALKVINDGGAVPGFTTERAFGRRKFISDDAVAALGVMFGLDLFERKPMTPPAVEKLGVPKDFVKQFTTTPETGRKLVARDASEKAREVFK